MDRPSEGQARAPRERRATPRYPARVQRAWLGWRERPDFQCKPAWILDISLHGCLVGALEVPPRDRPLLIRLDGSLIPVWYAVSFAGAERDDSGFWTVRFTFPGACPYDFFMAVAFGQVCSDAVRRQPPLPSFMEEAPPRRPGTWTGGRR